ncbi:MAG: Ada metal-binding domain-containing protein [Terrimicrobiaceae bacterium]
MIETGDAVVCLRTDKYLRPKTASRRSVLDYAGRVIPDFDVCYRALAARDPRFDGLFFVGIQTTGIYCRSICPARKPRASSCRFFESAAAAEHAGFRPCLRCRPEIAPGKGSASSLEEAIFRKLQSRAPHGESIEKLAALTGFSSRQMRRLLQEAFGLAPIEILQTERLLFAKRLLQETHLPMLLRPIVERHPGLRIAGAWSVFELGLRAILGQQISVAAATTLAGRLATRFGSRLEGSRHGLTHLAPTAERLSALNLSELASIGLPLARAKTLRAWAEHAAQGALDFPPGTLLENAVRRLREIRGIGEWTAHYIALRALRYPDAFPAADLGLRKAAGLNRPQALVARSLGWRPWRAYAAVYLWQSLSDSTHANSALPL